MNPNRMAALYVSWKVFEVSLVSEASSTCLFTSSKVARGREKPFSPVLGSEKEGEKRRGNVKPLRVRMCSKTKMQLRSPAGN